MRRFMILAVLLCVLVFVPNFGFTQNIEYSDLYITPETNPDFFGGYLGGDGDKANYNQWIDWSIGNSVVWSPTRTDDMVFSTNVGDFMNPNDWKERMRITKDGNVGIGTTSPGAKLSVSGGLAVGSSYDKTSVLDGDVIISGNLGIGSTNPGNSALVVLDGYVGIGTTVPTAPLTVHGTGTGTAKALVVEDSAFVQRMVVQDNGNVGIGTTSPGAKLEVVGDFEASTNTLSSCEWVGVTWNTRTRCPLGKIVAGVGTCPRDGHRDICELYCCKL